MTVKEYRDAVIALFKNGNATDEQWLEMAKVVESESESEYSLYTALIDNAVMGPLLECPHCDEEYREWVGCECGMTLPKKPSNKKDTEMSTNGRQSTIVIADALMNATEACTHERLTASQAEAVCYVITAVPHLLAGLRDLSTRLPRRIDRVRSRTID